MKSITENDRVRIARAEQQHDEALLALRVYHLARLLDPIVAGGEVRRCLTSLRRAVDAGQGTAEFEAHLRTIDEVRSIAEREPLRPRLETYRGAALALAAAVGDPDPWPAGRYAGDGSMTEDEIEAAALAVRAWWGRWHDELRDVVLASCPDVLDWRRGYRQRVAVRCRGRYVIAVVVDGCVVAVDAPGNLCRWSAPDA